MNKVFLIAIALLFFWSCSADDTSETEPTGFYSNGTLVLNEGGIGTVTFISQDHQNVENSIFQTNNEGRDLGFYVQSIFFNDDMAFVISNGSNLITIVNRYTFKEVGLIHSGLDVPRYGVVLDNYAYVTNQASFQTSEDDYIAKIDLNSFQVVDNLPLGKTVEYIDSYGGNLYVQNASYGFGNEISIVNPANGSIIDALETADGLNEFEIANGKLFALTASTLESYNLPDLSLVSEISLNHQVSPRHLELDGNNIYYTVSNSVYTLSSSSTSVPQESLLSYQSNSAYGVMYGFGVHDGNVYIADGGDFASESFIEIYNTSGDLIFSTDVGIAPNGFYFND